MKTYQLENDKVLIEFLDYGGIMTKMINKKTKVNYVLAYDCLSDYEENPYFLGATIGRNGGRTFPAYYTNYKKDKVALDQNEGAVHLHGGKAGLHRVFWQVEKIGQLSYRLIYVDEDSCYEPMILSLTYKLEDNRFSILMHGESEVATICNLTNHTYFNLNPSKKVSIEHHYLQTSKAEIQVIDEKFVPTGEYAKMASPKYAAFDFSQEKQVQKSLKLNTTLSKICADGIDLAYCFLEKGATRPRISLTDEKKLNRLKIYSNQESCVIYTLNKIAKQFSINDGCKLQKFGGITFEMQRKPNYVHHENPLTKEYEAYTIYEIE